ncbi:MAG: cytochrome c [Anaerolineae bacterium]
MKELIHSSLAISLALGLGLTACSSAVPASPTPFSSPSGDAGIGKPLYEGACVACHGPTGEGVKGLAQDMRASEFVSSKTDTELVEFIKAGRNPGDPHNVTGVGMPAKGGNPALSDEEIYHIVAYIRTLQK